MREFIVAVLRVIGLVVGILLERFNLSSAGSVNTCPAIENCMSFLEGPCDASGRRTVCMEWVESTRRNLCTLDPALNTIDHICVVGDQTTTIRNIGPTTPVCKHFVPAGAQVSFAISDGDRLPLGPSARLLNLPKTTRTANCTGYHDRVCDQFSNNDIMLTFTTSLCQRCTPVFLSPNKISNGGCVCRPRGVNTTCSVTCGRGTQMAVYDCTGTCGSSTQQVSIPCRCGPCSGLFDGDWSQWGPYDGCAVNCDTNVVEKERHRTCVGQRQSAGGRSCIGSPTELETCNSLIFSGGCRRRAPPAPQVQNSQPQLQPQLASNAASPAANAPVTIPTTGVIARAPMDTCSKISKCFEYYFGTCDASGNRHVCFKWASAAECGLPATYQVTKVCKEHAFASSIALPANTTICHSAVSGAPYRFGVSDGNRNINDNVAGIYTFRGNGSPVQASCSAYTNVCASGGSRDLEIKFDIPTCP